jgi:hypothetical protein
MPRRRAQGSPACSSAASRPVILGNLFMLHEPRTAQMVGSNMSEHSHA